MDHSVSHPGPPGTPRSVDRYQRRDRQERTLVSTRDINRPALQFYHSRQLYEKGYARYGGDVLRMYDDREQLMSSQYDFGEMLKLNRMPLPGEPWFLSPYIFFYELLITKPEICPRCRCTHEEDGFICARDALRKEHLQKLFETYGEDKFHALVLNAKKRWYECCERLVQSAAGNTESHFELLWMIPASTDAEGCLLPSDWIEAVFYTDQRTIKRFHRTWPAYSDLLRAAHEFNLMRPMLRTGEQLTKEQKKMQYAYKSIRNPKLFKIYGCEREWELFFAQNIRLQPIAILWKLFRNSRSKDLEKYQPTACEIQHALYGFEVYPNIVPSKSNHVFSFNRMTLDRNSPVRGMTEMEDLLVNAGNPECEWSFHLIWSSWNDLFHEVDKNRPLRAFIWREDIERILQYWNSVFSIRVGVSHVIAKSKMMLIYQLHDTSEDLDSICEIIEDDVNWGLKNGWDSDSVVREFSERLRTTFPEEKLADVYSSRCIHVVCAGS